MKVDREAFKQVLKEKGLRVTKQRLIVLETIASRPEEHLTAEDIYELVKADNPEIGLATIYRTIQLLNELHLIDRINLDDGFVRYEMGNAHDREKHRHHHLICTECGKVFSFRDDLLEELEKRIKSTVGFTVIDHEVKLFGRCSECTEKGK